MNPYISPKEDLHYTQREDDFAKDCVVYGKGGEAFFENDVNMLFEDQGMKLINVSDIRDYQKIDVDFVVTKDGLPFLPMTVDETVNSNEYIKIEVKVDCRAISSTRGATNNLAFEVTSHYKDGWARKTKADLIYMILADELPDGTLIKRILWINMKKWRDYIMDPLQPKRYSKCWDRNINGYFEDWLCDIDKLKAYGAIFKDYPAEHANNVKTLILK